MSSGAHRLGRAGVALLALVLPQTPAGAVAPRAAVEAFLVAAGGALLLRRGPLLWRRMTPREVTAVVGDGTLAEMIRRKLELFPDMHLSLLSDGDRRPFDELIEAADRVIFASERLEPGEVGDLVELCRERQVKLSVIRRCAGAPGPSASRGSRICRCSSTRPGIPRVRPR